MKETSLKPERPGGFIDFLPADYIAREQMVKKIDKVFRTFGFDPVETPIIEFRKTLAGETSETGKNIFHIKSDQDDEPLAMRFDHTVPFARLLAANPYEPKSKKGIRLPWRRMVYGPVFRGEKPQSGRYRQFYQFDADIAGTASMTADAEIIALMYHTIKALGTEKFIIRINNRKILNGLLESILLADDKKDVNPEKIKPDKAKEIMRILDKADKIGIKGVMSLLMKKPEHDHDPAPGLSEQAVKKVEAFVLIKGDNQQKLAKCKEVLKGIDKALQGIEELEKIIDFLNPLEVDEKFISIDFSIARGLDYYTGPVMETLLTDAPQFGSIFSGGRYDDLVRRFTGQGLPATGASIGIDRMFTAMCHIKAIDPSLKKTVSEVMVLNLMPDKEKEYLNIVHKIRLSGMNAEICLIDDLSFKGQFNFALNRGVDYVVIYGEDEHQKGDVQIKDLRTRQQTQIAKDKIQDYFKGSLL